MTEQDPGNSRRSRFGILQWRFLAPLLVLLAVLPLVAVIDVPGESKVKNALGVSVKPVGQECGEIRHAGKRGVGWRAERPLGSVGDHAPGVTIGDSIYFVGGLSGLDLSVKPATAVSIDSFRRYDVKSGRYNSLPPLPARLNHVVAAAYRGDVYVAGGHTDQLGRAEASDRAWRYRPAERRWTELEPMPTKRGAAGAAVVGHRMYVIGGRERTLVHKSMDVYDFKTGKWSEGPPMFTGRDHLGVEAYRGQIYVAGGRQVRDYSLGAFERYDVRRGKWTRLPDIPRPASSFELEVVSGRLVAAGGGDAIVRPNWISGQTWAYAPDSGKWSQLARMPEPKHGYASGVVGDRLYVLGGSRCGAFRGTKTTESLRIPKA